MKKNKTIEIEIDEDDFKIYQVYRPKEHVMGRNAFSGGPVASPFFGSQVLDKQTYIDNTGTENIDERLDFARKEEDKHMSREDLIKKYGTVYYEYQVLNNKKIDEITGYETKTEVKRKTINHKEVEKKKSKISFIETIDDINKEIIVEEKEPVNENKNDIINENTDFDVKITPEHEDIIKNNDIDSLVKRKQENLPKFIFEDDLDFNEIKEDQEDDVIEEIKNDELEDRFKGNEALDGKSNAAINNNEISSDDFKVEDIETINVIENKVETDEVNLEIIPYDIPYDNILVKTKTKFEEHPIWLEEKKDIINDTLVSFNISGEVINYIKGPSFTLYEILLSSGVNVKKVNQITENLQMNLKSKSIRILTPIPGRNTVGVEVPNDKRDTVLFSEIIDEDFINDGKPLNVSLGKDIYGNNVRQDITEMPHAIIAGATKSGKSVCINTILISLLLKNSPDNLRLILIDPKKVELSFYQEIPHLVCPVLDNAEEATEALKWAVEEMEKRFERLAQARVKSLEDYQKKCEKNPEMEPMPYIVIVIDEFNDLIMQCKDEANECIIRLAQKARAAGIHVMLATQRPTTDVVNGTIKSNIPCRIAFKVADFTNSSVILDEGGAETLLGRGDMLIKNNDVPQRAQGAYIADDEIESICNYISSKYHKEFMFTDADLRNKINSKNATTTVGGGKDLMDATPELLYDIGQFCIQTNNCSINAIQTNFNLGFNRAHRIVNQLQELGVVSEKNGNKPREILVDTYELRKILELD